MPATLRKPRRVRLAMFAVAGATALSIAACSSNTASPPASTSAPSSSAGVAAPTTSPPGPHNGEARVTGLIESVSGTTAEVNNTEKGKSTVGFSSSTKISEATPAALTDVTAGSCISVQPSHDSEQPVTAASVRVSEPVDGKCPQAKESGTTSTPPSSTPAPGGPPAKLHSQIRGTVASVAGNTINITSDGGGGATQTAVAVDEKTKYSKQTPTNTQAITEGKCMTAWGTKDGSGTLQATRIDLVAHSAKCEGRPHHGG
jgi:Domain of unknown function (DUF5666)